VLTIALSAPSELLRHFASPGDVLQRFLEALEVQGLDLGATMEIRTRIDAGARRFVVRWAGEVESRAAAMRVLPRVSEALGITAYGENE